MLVPGPLCIITTWVTGGLLTPSSVRKSSRIRTASLPNQVASALSNCMASQRRSTVSPAMAMQTKNAERAASDDMTVASSSVEPDSNFSTLATVSVDARASTMIPMVGSRTNGIVPLLVNLVATFSLGVRFDLKEIAKRARNSEYNPKRFTALIMRIREPKATALIFSTGKVVVTGSKSEYDSHRASRKFAKVMKKVGNQEAIMSDYKIQNMVAKVDVKFPIRLEKLAQEHHAFCEYEPEIFPALIYRMIQPKIVLLIFFSGKVVLTGGKSQAELAQAFDNIYPVLLTARKTFE